VEIENLQTEKILTAGEEILEILDIQNLKELCATINEGLLDDRIVDYASLPKFGGETPTDTAGVFSWDSKNVLKINGSAYIVSRTDCK